MKILLTSLYIISISSTIYIIATKRFKKVDYISVLKETPMTYLFGILLWIEAALILYVVWMFPDQWLNSTNAYINTFVFISAGSLLGGYSFLFCTVKETIATEHKLIAVSFIGDVTEIRWKDIISIEKTGKSKLKVSSKKQTITISGPKKTYAQFIMDIEHLIPNSFKNEIQL